MGYLFSELVIVRVLQVNALVQAMARALWMTSLQEHCGVSPHYKLQRVGRDLHDRRQAAFGGIVGDRRRSWLNSAAGQKLRPAGKHRRRTM